jgi:hypothetical protein
MYTGSTLRQASAGAVTFWRTLFTTLALDFYTNVLGFEKRVDSPKPDDPRA